MNTLQATATTAAERIVREGYGDTPSAGMSACSPFHRNLNFRVGAETPEAFRAMLHAIGGYNDFSPDRVLAAWDEHVAPLLNEYSYRYGQVSVGRESSPVIYVDTTAGDATPEHMVEALYEFGKAAGADECHAMQYEGAELPRFVRLWWD